MADNPATIRALHTAFDAGDIDRALDMLTDDVTLADVPSGQTLIGKDAFRGWLETWRTALPDAKTEIRLIVDAGESAASTHIGRGTHSGPLRSPQGEIPPTGRSVELEIAEVFRFEGGKIREMRAYYDTATMMRQLGLMPEPVSA